MANLTDYAERKLVTALSHHIVHGKATCKPSRLEVKVAGMIYQTTSGNLGALYFL